MRFYTRLCCDQIPPGKGRRGGNALKTKALWWVSVRCYCHWSSSPRPVDDATGRHWDHYHNQSQHDITHETETCFLLRLHSLSGREAPSTLLGREAQGPSTHSTVFLVVRWRPLERGIVPYVLRCFCWKHKQNYRLEENWFVGVCVWRSGGQGVDWYNFLRSSNLAVMGKTSRGCNHAKVERPYLKQTVSQIKPMLRFHHVRRHTHYLSWVQQTNRIRF